MSSGSDSIKNKKKRQNFFFFLDFWVGLGWVRRRRMTEGSLPPKEF
jgi:hypothetical protein